MSREPNDVRQQGAPLTHANSAERAWQIFTTQIETRQLRMTQARRHVFEEVFRRHDHFTADQLAANLTQGEKRVSRSTVYNTLSLLVEAGLVSEIRDLQGSVRYEHSFGHPAHDHMICEECGALFEFSDDTLAEKIDANCAQTGFVRRAHRISVFGVCREFVESGPQACPHHQTRQCQSEPPWSE